MTIPRKVREQGEAAEAAHKQMLADRLAGQQGSDPQNTQQPAQQGQPGQPAGEQPTPAAVVMNWEAEARDLATRLEASETRHRVLKGKYDSEVPRLTSEVRELREKLESAGKAGGSPATPDAFGSPASPKADEMREMYGDDLLAYIKAEATAAATTATKDVKSKVDAISSTQAARTETDFFGALDKAHADWRQINQLSTWLRWLAEKDVSGIQRQEIVDRAMGDGNPAPIINLLAEFKNATSSNGNSGRVVPAEGGAAPLPGGGDTRSYTQSEISKFYQNKATGRWRGTDAEYAAQEAIYEKASREGRVLMGQ